MKKIILISYTVLMLFCFISCNKPPQEENNEEKSETIEYISGYENIKKANEGDLISASGIVSAIIKLDNRIDMIIQNDEAGYYVYNYTNKNSSVVVGNKILVTGNKGLYASRIEFVNPKIRIISKEVLDIEPIDITELIRSGDFENDEWDKINLKLVMVKGALFNDDDTTFMVGENSFEIHLNSRFAWCGSENVDEINSIIRESQARKKRVTIIGVLSLRPTPSCIFIHSKNSIVIEE